MRLRTKLLFLFLASGGFLLLEGLVAAYGLGQVGTDVDRLQRYTQTDDLCAQVKTELARLPGYRDLAELAGQQGPVGSWSRRLTDTADRILILCTSLGKLTSTERSRAAIERVADVVTRYRQAGRAYAQALQEERPPERVLDARNAAKDTYERLSLLQDEGVIEPVGKEARLAIKRVVRRAERLNRWVTFGGLSLAVTLTLVSAIVLARVTAQPIVRLLRAAREVGHGNLDVSVSVRGNDELAQLSRAFNDMTLRLKQVYSGLEAEVRKRTDELRMREEDLERERRLAAIGRLATGVAHEVSSPLTVIAGAAEGLRDRAQDEELKRVEAFEDFPDYLETIESEAYRLKRLVRRLLDFSRNKPTKLHPLDLAPVIVDAVSLARLDPLAKEHPVQLDLREGPEGPLPLYVRGDEDALKEALLNLLFNALKAVRDTRGGHVEVSGRGEKDAIAIRVRDTGVGIAPGDLEKIFEPFFTTAKEGEGTGLGLSLVYGTLERHEGTIHAESEGSGKGATFVVRLPRLKGRGSSVRVNRDSLRVK
ncbi:MAG: HAMP domain-containing sensor histidine kinase [Planctomycetota bacterium]